MLKSQTLSVQISETRQELSSLIEKRNKLSDGTEPEAADVKRMDDSTRKLQRLEVEYRAAMVTEQAAEEKRKLDEPHEPEEKERNQLLARASLVPFVMEAMEGRAVTGAEKEVRAAVLGDVEGGENQIPIDLLLPQEWLEQRAMGVPNLETRADVVTPVAAAALADGSQAAVLPRVFARSIAGRLGVAMPSVPVGAAVYPIMTGGTTAAMAADGTQVDAAAGTFTGHTLEPVRLTAAYLFNARQTLQLRNFEAILRRDLTAVLSDKMDDQIVNGTGVAPNVSGFVTELTVADDPAAVTTWAQFLALFTAEVDGLNAYMLSDLRAVVGKATFGYASSLFRTGATDNGPRESAHEYVRTRIGGVSVSSRIAAGDVQTNIMALLSYPGRNAVAPVWRGMELIRDPYTAAGKGQVRLTAIMFWNFKILREAGWKLWKVKNA